ncbi:MAG: alpha/beta fold hydrolase [Phycisphaerae bacterium]|nr:alpha/beta hydrolase [Phycisphaerae bacterium]NIP51932.1 alpha/beta hydrolase [Phycisphaerae bacterium]NIS51053.1 alpha/beta hydrolase [Phycisphaerae bacterium]NIU08668.1 alpha/beta hydrolase [Phycisphaerae bacterium]NIU56299.1 alpha/beta fold hydrolase [Phycisphaerae bacterium]
MGSMLITIFIVLFVAYWGMGIILYIMQPHFLYCPVREVVYTPEELGMDFEDVVFKTDDGLSLNGWYIPAENSHMTVLFCHGNGGNIMHRLDSINIFYNLGLNCFIFDYRGYGSSEGKPGEEGTYLDVKAAYEWLTKEKKVSPNNIIIFGRSLGGSIAAQLASKVRSRALIIESTFTSYVDIGRKFYPYMPVRWFARFSYRTIDYIRDVRCPVMIIHSRSDDVVPFEFGLELYEAANAPKEFVEIIGSHNDGFLVSGEVYKKSWTKWLQFLKESERGADRHRAS